MLPFPENKTTPVAAGAVSHFSNSQHIQNKAIDGIGRPKPMTTDQRQKAGVLLTELAQFGSALRPWGLEIARLLRAGTARQAEAIFEQIETILQVARAVQKRERARRL